MQKLILATIILAAAHSYTFAQEGLYAEPPPPDAAFVRLLAAAPVQSTSVEINGVTLQIPAVGVAGVYSVVTQGPADITVGTATLSAELAAKHGYTIVVSGGQSVMIEDALEPNLTKSTIVFYNITGIDTLGLTTADGATPVFDAVPSDTTKQIAVNPLTIAFGASVDGAVVAKSDEIKMERGAIYSVVASGAPGSITLTISKNSIAAN